MLVATFPCQDRSANAVKLTPTLEDSMSFDAALVREQGVSFAVVVVKSHVVQSDASRRQAISAFSHHFPGVPIVLMAQDSRGTPTFWGRPDIVRFLARIPTAALPWKRFP